MRLSTSTLALFLFGFVMLSAPGCGGSDQATVAPRTEDEIEAYKADVYAAEEEDDLAAAEDE